MLLLKRERLPEVPEWLFEPSWTATELCHKDGRQALDRDSARCHASNSQRGKLAAASYPGG